MSDLDLARTVATTIFRNVLPGFVLRDTLALAAVEPELVSEEPVSL
jgi:hypothetical protein